MRTGIENAVAQRLQPQRLEARLRLARNNAAAAGQMIEIFQDHPRVVIGGAVVEDQRRNFSDRILRPDAVGRVVEIGFAHVDLVGEPEQAGRDAYLAAERRSGRGSEDHLEKYSAAAGAGRPANWVKKRKQLVGRRLPAPPVGAISR